VLEVIIQLKFSFVFFTTVIKSPPIEGKRTFILPFVPYMHEHRFAVQAPTQGFETQLSSHSTFEYGKLVYKWCFVIRHNVSDVNTSLNALSECTRIPSRSILCF